MALQTALEKKAAVLVGTAAAVFTFLRFLFFYRLPVADLVQRIPDDAFYYMQSARNFAQLGRWTFDGTEPASGFHLLWGYLLAFFFRLAPHASLHEVFLWGTLFQIACYSLAAYFVAATSVRLFGSGGAAGVAAIFLSATCLMQSAWLMESPFVLLGAALTLWLLCREGLELHRRSIAGALLLGVFLTLARSDSGLLPFVLFLALFLLWRRGCVAASMPTAGALVVGGAVAGLVAVSLHTHWISGSWVQSSAGQKAFWTHVTGYSILNITHFVLSFFTPLWNATPLFTTNSWSRRGPHLLGSLARAFLLGLLLWTAFGMVWRRASSFPTRMLLAMWACVAAFVLFYGFNNAAVNSWYVTNFACPLALVAAATSAYFARRRAAAVFTTAIGLSLIGFFFSLQPTFPWQEPMYRAGLYLHAHPDDRPVAAFNAGILSFFGGGDVINVDGLVNDSILSYARKGTLAQYFADRHAAYLLDFPQIFTEDMPLRGGYADGKLQGCVQSSVDLFPEDPNNVYAGSRIRLYHFNPACLAAAYGSPHPVLGVLSAFDSR